MNRRSIFKLFIGVLPTVLADKSISANERRASIGQINICADGINSSEIARNVQRQIERIKTTGTINSSLTG